MKQKVMTLVSLFILAVLSSSCIFMSPPVKGNGNVVEEKRKAGKFNEIKVSRGMNVYISQGNENEVLVKADDNLLEFIETEVEGRVLKVTANRNIGRATSKKVLVTVRDLKSIQSVAGSNVFSEEMLKCKDLDLQGSAGSNIKIEVSAENMDVRSSAGSNVKIDGQTKFFTGKASAGSNIKAEGLTAINCNAETSSGANIWITVTDEFQANASSGGNIFYSGSPKTTNIKRSSGGNIIKN